MKWKVQYVMAHLKVHQMSKLITLSQVNVDRKAKCTTMAVKKNNNSSNSLGY